jgi:hypothetical protein
MHFLAKKSSKKKVLDMYATAIKRKQKKMQKHVSERKPRELASSESDSDFSLHIIESPKPKKSSTKLKTRMTDERTLKSVARKKTRTKSRNLTGRSGLPEKGTVASRPRRVR